MTSCRKRSQTVPTYNAVILLIIKQKWMTHIGMIFAQQKAFQLSQTGTFSRERSQHLVRRTRGRNSHWACQHLKLLMRMIKLLVEELGDGNKLFIAYVKAAEFCYISRSWQVFWHILLFVECGLVLISPPM